MVERIVGIGGGECVEGTGGRGEVGEVRWGARRGG